MRVERRRALGGTSTLGNQIPQPLESFCCHVMLVHHINDTIVAATRLLESTLSQNEIEYENTSVPIGGGHSR